MAPKATIYLVEAQSNSFADLLGAVKCANSFLTSAGGGELSMSWGASEFAAAELTAVYNAKSPGPTTAFTIPASGYCGSHASYSVASTWNFCVGVGTVRGTPFLADRDPFPLSPVSFHDR